MHRTIADRATARHGFLFIIAAGILWGTSGVATRAIYGLVDVSPITIAAFRLGLGAPMLWVALRCLLGRSTTHSIAPQDLGWLTLAGIALGVSQAFYFASILRIGVAIATLVTISAAPVLVGLLSAPFLHERLTPTIGMALACALMGTALLVGVGPADTNSSWSMKLQGTLMAFGAATCFGTFILVSRHLAGRYHPLHAVAIAVTVGAVPLIIASAVTFGTTVAFPPAAWALFLYLGLVPTALAYGLFYLGMRSATATAASIAALAEPLTSTVLAFLIFDERLGPYGVPGTILLVGTLLFLYRKGGNAA